MAKQNSLPAQSPCPHDRFRAQLSMRKVVDDPGKYVVDISVMCKACNRFLRFLNLPNDGTVKFAHTDEEGLAVSLPCEIASTAELFKD